MKHTILDLKKKVLVVETLDENLACAYFFNKYGFYFMKKMKFICKGSEITEEITKSFNHQEEYSESMNINLFRFVQHLKYKGFHWLENPLGGKPKITTDSNCFELIAKHNDWQQAEEKTFRNCLIFEIL